MKLFRQLESGDTIKVGDLWSNTEQKRMEEVDLTDIGISYDSSTWAPIFRPVKIENLSLRMVIEKESK